MPRCNDAAAGPGRKASAAAATASDEGLPPTLRLPPEVFHTIFHFAAPSAILAASTVCKRLSALALDDVVWELAYKARFKDNPHHCTNERRVPGWRSGHTLPGHQCDAWDDNCGYLPAYVPGKPSYAIPYVPPMDLKRFVLPQNAVELHGLQKAQELNGMRGVAKEPPPGEEGERLVVRLFPAGHRAPIRVRRCNMRPAEGPVPWVRLYGRALHDLRPRALSGHELCRSPWCFQYQEAQDERAKPGIFRPSRWDGDCFTGELLLPGHPPLKFQLNITPDYAAADEQWLNIHEFPHHKVFRLPNGQWRIENHAVLFTSSTESEWQYLEECTPCWMDDDQCGQLLGPSGLRRKAKGEPPRKLGLNLDMLGR